MIIVKKVKQEVEWVDHDKGVYNEKVSNWFFFCGIPYRWEVGIITHDLSKNCSSGDEQQVKGFGR